MLLLLVSDPELGMFTKSPVDLLREVLVRMTYSIWSSQMFVFFTAEKSKENIRHPQIKEI